MKKHYNHALTLCVIIFLMINIPINSMQPGDSEGETKRLNKGFRDYKSIEDIPMICISPKVKNYKDLGDVASSKKDNLMDFHLPIMALPIEVRERIAKFAARNNLSACLFFLFDNGLITEKCKKKLKKNWPDSLKHTRWVINRIKNCNTPEDISALKGIAILGNLGINPWNDPLLKNKSISENMQELINSYVENSNIYARNLYNQLTLDSTIKSEMIELNGINEEIAGSLTLTSEISEILRGYYHTRDLFLRGAFLKERKERSKTNKRLKYAALSGLGCCCCSTFLLCPAIGITGCMFNIKTLAILGLGCPSLSLMFCMTPVAPKCFGWFWDENDRSKFFTNTPNLEPLLKSARYKLKQQKQSLAHDSQLLVFDNRF